MISQWQSQFNALMRGRCRGCYGVGALDNARPGDVLFSVWTCDTCGGTGYSPQPQENMAPNNVPELPHG